MGLFALPGEEQWPIVSCPNRGLQCFQYGDFALLSRKPEVVPHQQKRNQRKQDQVRVLRGVGWCIEVEEGCIWEWTHVWAGVDPGIINRGRKHSIRRKSGGGAGKARFNVATPTNATVTCTAYVLPYNLQTKIHLPLFQEGFNVEPRRIFG